MEGNVCKACGYVELIFPTSVPDDIKKFNDQRLEVIKSILKEQKNKVEAASDTAESLRQELDDNKRMLASARERCDSLRREGEEARARYSEHAENASHEIERLKMAAHNLSAQLNEARATPATPRAYLILNDRNDLTVLPIIEDRINYFASPRGRRYIDGRIQLPVMELPVLSDSEIAFSVRPDDGSYRFTDLSGTLRVNGAPIKNDRRLPNLTKIEFPGNRFFLSLSTLED